MTVRLDLKPEVEAYLATRARARGVALDAYLEGVIEDLARSEVAPPGVRGRPLGSAGRFG